MTSPASRLTTELADRYQIERELGAGGMATVYLAHDVRHDRHVALKVLQPELSAILGAERFLHEIRTTANLQHPHILGLHDSGEAGGLVYYVMPYVEGESLRDRLKREHQLPVDEAVRIACEVLSALDYAHRHGVVHRDIKPENILLHDGSALVADFGIALAVSRSDGGTRMTETGMSLGTPHYMAPEQAMGEREITPRVDVYAAGCVLYEMLTGEPPFTGPTAQAIVARVMTEAPRSLTLQRHTIPPHVEGAVHVALEKLPADRFSSAAQFAEALTKPGTIPHTRVAAAAMRPLFSSRRVVALAAVAAAALAVAVWALLRPLPSPPVVRYALALPEDQAPIPVGSFTLSPDGEWLAYWGPGTPVQLWLKSRSQINAVPLAGTAALVSADFSPDGKWIAFVQRSELRKVPVTGGAAITLSDSASSAVDGVAWMDDGTIAFIRTFGGGIWRIPEDGGERTQVWKPDSGSVGTIAQLASLPGSRGLLVVRCQNSPCRPERDLWAVDVRAGTAARLQTGALAGVYISTGHVLYARPDGAMLALPFNARSLRATGAPIPVLDSVTVVNSVFPLFAASPNGTLAVRLGGSTVNRTEYTMVWVDRGGREVAVDTAWRFRHAVSGGNAGWSLSPDGRRVAIGLNTDAGDDIWVKELPRGPLSRVTFDSLPDIRPRWSPDGRTVLYTTQASGALRTARADGSRGDSTLLDLPVNMWESAWTRDRRLIVRSGGQTGIAGDRRLFTYRLGTDTTLVPLITSDQFDAAAFVLSPDEKWIAYESNETGRTEVYVRPFPLADAGKVQVSTRGGRSPIWSRNGREIFFVDSARNMNAVTVAPGIVPQIGARQVLFRLPPEIFFRDAENYSQFDVAADGRFLMARRVRLLEGEIAPLVITENWFTELRARLR